MKVFQLALLSVTLCTAATAAHNDAYDYYQPDYYNDHSYESGPDVVYDYGDDYAPQGVQGDCCNDHTGSGSGSGSAACRCVSATASPTLGPRGGYIENREKPLTGKAKKGKHAKGKSMHPSLYPDMKLGSGSGMGKGGRLAATSGALTHHLCGPVVCLLFLISTVLKAECLPSWATVL
jgi:hypothetical protein